MRFRYILPVLTLALGAGIPARANLIINPIFDTSITGDSVNGAQVEATINQAIAFFDSTYANPITVTIEFQEMTSGLGDSQVGFAYNENYQSYYNALVATDANPAAIAGLTANGGDNSRNPVSGTRIINVKGADLRAVGLAGAGLCNVTGTAGNLTCSDTAGGPNAIDGIVGLNTSLTSPPGSASGDYDLLSVAEHEIDEVLGLGSALPNCDSGAATPCTSASAPNPEPEDLFRYTSKGVFASINVQCSSLTQAYLSYSGASVLTNTNTACNGDDWGDWAIGGPTQVQDAVGTPGVQIPYGANEIAAMTAIGYQLAAPEPGTWVLMLSSVGVIGLVKRRYPGRHL